MTTKVRNVILAVVLLILGIFAFGWVLGHKSGKSSLEPTVSALSKDVDRYVIELGNNKLYVSSVEQELESIRQAKANGEITNTELRKLNLSQANEISRLKLSIDTLLNVVSNNGQIIVTYDTVASDTIHKAIKLPFTFDKSDKWLNLHGMFNNEGKLDIGLKMDMPIDLITGIGKDKKPTAIITTSNPYIRSLYISSIKTDTPKNKKFNISVSAGYGVSKTGLSPIFGITGGVTIFRF